MPCRSYNWPRVLIVDRKDLGLVGGGVKIQKTSSVVKCMEVIFCEILLSSHLGYRLSRFGRWRPKFRVKHQPSRLAIIRILGQSGSEVRMNRVGIDGTAWIQGKRGLFGWEKYEGLNSLNITAILVPPEALEESVHTERDAMTSKVQSQPKILS